jgi:molybdenum cofactor cytidylyltransferase
LNFPAIILAAGSASRMGRAKQLLRIEGRSLIQRAAQAAIGANCKPVIVVTGSNSDAIKAELANLPVEIQFNPDWSAGIGTSIRAGLSAVLKSNPVASAVILTLCDQPHLSSEILRSLIITHIADSKSMTACEYSGTLGPPCCFSRAMFDELSKLDDQSGAKRLLMKNPNYVATISWPEGAVDLDTPKDWRDFSDNSDIET